MANSKIYLGSTNIGSLFQGADDISIYLGENKVYPLEEPFKWKATYSDSHTESAQCDSSSEIVSGEINLDNLVSVEIGDCVTNIEYSAFDSCSGLTSVTIGSGVTSIGDSAFYACSGLTSIDIPNSVTSIGDFAFHNCTSLTSITIGNGVTSIGNVAFRNCSGLTSVTIPDSVISIGRDSFYFCSGLTSITVEAVTPPTLGNRAFYDSTCPIYVPCESVEAYKSASGWSTYASRITCPPFEGKFKATYSDGREYELDCDGDATLTTTNTKPTGYEYSAMTESIIGDCVTEIDFRAFSGCTNLSSVTIPDSVTSIGVSAFHDCSALTSVYVPDSVISIDDMSFRNCKKLTTVHLPSGLTIISESLFLTCTSLTSIDIPSGVTSIGNGAIRFCQSLTTIDIPSGVTSIGRGAFYECSGLTSVTVNAITPPTLGSEAFNGTTCPIYVPCESVEAYKSASGWSTYASRITCVQPPFEGKWKATYSDSSVTSAECDSSSAITQNEISKTNLVSAEIGDCVTSIGEFAFDSCLSLTSIVIPDSVTSIGESAFNYCTGLTSCTIGSGVTSISKNAFRNCSGLTSIDIPSGATSIGFMAFQECSSLTSIGIPSGVTSIGDMAFDSCRNLTSITVNATTPPQSGDFVFEGSTCPIYVPAQSVETYKRASGWRDYASRIQAIP